MTTPYTGTHMTTFRLLSTLVFGLLFKDCISTKLEVGGVKNSDSEAAKAQLQKIQSQTKHMRYGECWTKALGVLQSGCKRLTDEIQRRIAYAFARCHLQASGRIIPECPDEKPMTQCTDSETLPDIAFNTYTEFFTHTQQICFHLQNQAWHEETENTISRLADNSAEVATHLEHSSIVAQEMIVRQNKSLQNQEVLLENEERLKNSMQQSVLDVQRSHAETKAIISEQRALFSEVFERVAVLQKTVLGEFSSIYTFGFYVGSTLLAYILTSTTRTSSARIWLFLILMLNGLTERFITQYYVNPINGSTSFAPDSLGSFIPELIYEQTWLCRQFFSVFALLVLFTSACRYKDYNIINNALLNEIKQQNQQLQNYIKENIHDVGQVATTTSVEHGNGIRNEMVGKTMLMEKHQSDVTTLSHHEQNVTLSEADTTLRPSTNMAIDLTDSDNESDCTFRHSEIGYPDSDMSSVASFISLGSKSTHSAMARINTTRRSSTPLRESSSVCEDRANTSQMSLSVRRSRRRSSMLAVLDESATNVEPPSDCVVVGGYSLRRRPASPVVNKSVLRRETVEEFTSYVLHELAEQSCSKRHQIRQHLADRGRSSN